MTANAVFHIVVVAISIAIYPHPFFLASFSKFFFNAPVVVGEEDVRLEHSLALRMNQGKGLTC